LLVVKTEVKALLNAAAKGRGLTKRKYLKGKAHRDNKPHLYGKLKPGDEITDLLKNSHIPSDCHKVNSNHYKKLVDMMLAMYSQEDPDEIYFDTRIKYYWKQTFPANSITRISHAYTPSLSGSIGHVPTSYVHASKNLNVYINFISPHRHLPNTLILNQVKIELKKN